MTNMRTDSLFAPRVLEGKLALVTGAGQGNGRAIAMGLSKAGASLLVTDLNLQSAKDVAFEISQTGAMAWAFELDVTSQTACTALAEEIDFQIGSIDILVNNAGIIIREGVDSEQAVNNLERMLDVNVVGTFIPTHTFLPALKAQQGCVINVGSIASFAGLAGTLGYSPSKGAVRLLTQSLAVELAKDGVRVNAIAPGVIETPMTEITRNNPQSLSKFMSRTPMGRVGQPDELIGPVVFLASPMASYITGVILPVDGGFLAA